MDVRVEKSGGDDFSGHVDLVRTAVGSHTDEQTVRYGDIVRAQFVREHIQICCVLQNEIRRGPSGGDSNQVLLSLYFSVDFG